MVGEVRICVSSRIKHGENTAKILGADFRYCPKDEYDLLLKEGFYCARFEEELEALKIHAKKIVLFVGTDITQLTHDYAKIIKQHSDHIITQTFSNQQELAQFGIEADLVVKSPLVLPTLHDNPAKTTVAVYMPNTQTDLYQEAEISLIASLLPEIDFLIYNPLGSYPENRVGNVIRRGEIELDELLDRSTCLLRITKHDGLPLSAIEFMLSGKQVITNQEIDYAIQVKDADEAIVAIQTLEKPKPHVREYWLNKCGQFKENILRYLKGKQPYRVKLSPFVYGQGGVHEWMAAMYKTGKITPSNSPDIIHTTGIGERYLPRIDVMTVGGMNFEENYDGYHYFPKTEAKEDFLVVNEIVKRNCDRARIVTKTAQWITDGEYVPNHTYVHIDYNGARFPYKDYWLFLGSELYVKRLCDFIEISRRFPNEKFIACGKNVTDQIVFQRGYEVLDNIQFLGELSGQEKYDALNGARGVIQPSVMDCSPHVDREAMLCEGILLARDSGGHTELIEHGVTGYLWNDLDELEVLMKTELDQSIREKARLKILKDHNVDNIIDQYIKIYDRLAFQGKGKSELLSIIVNIYNQEPLIEQCLESLMAQDHPNIEIILVDDCSTDQSVHKIGRFIDGERVKLVNTPRNLGSAGALNEGLRHATGDFIAWVCADDIVTPDYASSGLKALESADFVIPNGYTVDLNGNKSVEIEGWGDKWDLERYKKESYLCNGGWIMKRKVLTELGGFDTMYETCSDYEFILRVAEKFKIVKNNKQVYGYRQAHRNSNRVNKPRDKHSAEIERLRANEQ